MMLRTLAVTSLITLMREKASAICARQAKARASDAAHPDSDA